MTPTALSPGLSTASREGSATKRLSVLGRLRSLIPMRDTTTFGEALIVAERQAGVLCRLLDARDDGLTEQHLTGLPRVQVEFADLPVSGMSHWNGQVWVIRIAQSDSLARQRFTLLHEFKHIVDHGHAARLYRGNRAHTAAEQAELAADYFAGCALVPKRLLKSAWGSGLQRPAVLADYFSVSEQAIRVRLAQTGLDRAVDHEPAPRCARPTSTPRGQAQEFRRAFRRSPQ